MQDAKGAAGTAVAHSHTYGDKMPDDVTGFLYLKDDNSDYKGIWKLYNHNNAKDRAGVVLVLDHPHAAGGEPVTFRDDAIQILMFGDRPRRGVATGDVGTDAMDDTHQKTSKRQTSKRPNLV